MKRKPTLRILQQGDRVPPPEIYDEAWRRFFAKIKGAGEDVRDESDAKRAGERAGPADQASKAVEVKAKV